MKKETVLNQAMAASDELDTLYATLDTAKEATSNHFLEDVYTRILEMLDGEQDSLAKLIAEVRKSISKEE